MLVEALALYKLLGEYTVTSLPPVLAVAVTSSSLPSSSLEESNLPA